MSKHTSGPWRVQDREEKRGIFTQGLPPIIYCSQKNFAIAMLGSGDMVYQNAHANARLIAAAPELLQAAHRALAALRANGAPNCEAAKELLAAIAKAEGE